MPSFKMKCAYCRCWRGVGVLCHFVSFLTPADLCFFFMRGSVSREDYAIYLWLGRAVLGHRACMHVPVFVLIQSPPSSHRHTLTDTALLSKPHNSTRPKHY